MALNNKQWALLNGEVVWFAGYTNNPPNLAIIVKDSQVYTTNQVPKPLYEEKNLLELWVVLTKNAVRFTFYSLKDAEYFTKVHGLDKQDIIYMVEKREPEDFLKEYINKRTKQNLEFEELVVAATKKRSKKKKSNVKKVKSRRTTRKNS